MTLPADLDIVDHEHDLARAADRLLMLIAADKIVREAKRAVQADVAVFGVGFIVAMATAHVVEAVPDEITIDDCVRAIMHDLRRMRLLPSFDDVEGHA